VPEHSAILQEKEGTLALLSGYQEIKEDAIFLNGVSLCWGGGNSIQKKREASLFSFFFRLTERRKEPFLQAYIQLLI
jgi:hypothetical protein